MPNLWAAGAIGAIILTCLLAGLAYARKAGKDAVKLEAEHDNAEAGARIAEAAANAPLSRAELVEELRKGGGL